MDEEYHCKARPNMSSTVDTNNISSDPHDKYFKIEFDYRDIWVQTDTNHQSFGNIRRYTLHNLSIDKLMQQTTITSWLSHMNVPKDAFMLVVEEILLCAREMVNGTYKNLRFLCIRVDFSLTMAIEEDEEEIEVDEEDNGLVPPISRATESESYEDDYEVNYEDDYGYGGNNGLEEFEDEMEVEEEDEEEDNGLVPPITRAIESESDEDDYEVSYEDDYGYGWNNSLEEDEEEMEVEEDNRFVPAAKSCIEGLKMVKVEEVEKCAICFEDFNVGVRMPCSHMFHMTCIREWLVIGNSCPLCRYQLPTSNMSE